ncbi:adenylate/guanylate cyclase domain-containing protein [Stenotrophomonas sp. 22385]|uniref:adenylate/guanylate cyclase domain-containing protein n=1 Tax=Stenotrophomonas sp. 22385 TaxID=3453915 RepID=UPI003F86913C
MSLSDDLLSRVEKIASSAWDITPGRVVPDLTALPLANAGKSLRACILYADLSDSTGIVGRNIPSRAAEYYKAFLHCASRLIIHNGGIIEAYDGDRVMGVFLGIGKEQNAVQTAFQLVRAMETVVNKTFSQYYGATHEQLKFTVGIDTGEVLVCKAGVRGDSDLVWVGAPANYAAKLNSFKGLDHAYPIRITDGVFRQLPDSHLYRRDGKIAWAGAYNAVGVDHYRSNAWAHL